MAGPTAGARFNQTQPVAAKKLGNLDGTGSPYTLLTVPQGKTYRLRYASVQLVVAADSTYTSNGSGESATVQDSNGNTWAECEAFITAAGTNCPTREVQPCEGAVLPPGTVVTLQVGGAPLTTMGLHVRMGGGVVWVPA